MASESKFKKVLVIDDDMTVLRIIEERLKKLGFEVSISKEADEGLQKAMHTAPDLIILDVMMPVINGYNFCHLLKTQQEKKHIPVIFLTSRDTKDDVKIGLDVGADAYLTKPISMDELLKTIKLVETMHNQS